VAQGVKPDKKTEDAVVARLAQGMSERKVAQEVGTTRNIVHGVSVRHRAIIEKETARYVEEGLENIADRAIREIAMARNMSDDELRDSKNHQFLKRVDAKEEGILKAVGIAPSHGVNMFIQNVFNDNRKAVINPVVMGILSEHTKGLLEED
jgi:hypothetical protein